MEKAKEYPRQMHHFYPFVGDLFLRSFAVLETIYSTASISPCKSGCKYGSGHTQQNLQEAKEQLKFSI